MDSMFCEMVSKSNFLPAWSGVQLRGDPPCTTRNKKSTEERDRKQINLHLEYTTYMYIQYMCTYSISFIIQTALCNSGYNAVFRYVSEVIWISEVKATTHVALVKEWGGGHGGQGPGTICPGPQAYYFLMRMQRFHCIQFVNPEPQALIVHV